MLTFDFFQGIADRTEEIRVCFQNLPVRREHDHRLRLVQCFKLALHLVMLGRIRDLHHETVMTAFFFLTWYDMRGKGQVAKGQRQLRRNFNALFRQPLRGTCSFHQRREV